MTETINLNFPDEDAIFRSFSNKKILFEDFFFFFIIYFFGANVSHAIEAIKLNETLYRMVSSRGLCKINERENLWQN